jgi:pyruvate/2-oxoglutarate dehydrogenase complex dihydrolipoamide dehydrogenase (E3) component
MVDIRCFFVIGMEFAQFLIGMGTEVTIIEMLPGLVHGVDKEIATLQP